MAGSVLAGGPKAVQAWVAATNAKGGIDCHPIKYVVLDDGGDPSRNQALTQQLVETDGALAIVQSDAVFAGQASVGYLTQKQIPVIGSEGASPWFYQSPMYFPQESSGVQFIAAGLAVTGDIGRLEGKTKLAVLSCIEVSICSGNGDFARQHASRFGLDPVYIASASIAQPDYTANCQTAQRAGATIFEVAMDTNSVARVARSCASVNYHPQYTDTALVASPAMLKDPNLDGMAFSSVVLPWMISTNADIAAYQSALKRYAPGLAPDGSTIAGWVSAKLFELATQHLSDPATSQGILAGLWAVQNNDVGGLTQPLTFVRGQNAPPALCYWTVQIQHGQYVSPNGGQRTCVPPV